MNRNERRRQNRKILKKNTRTGDGARRQIVTIPSSESGEESKQDHYRDEGGES